MMKRSKLIEKLVRQPKNFPFSDALKIARIFGFLLDRVHGSHHILKHPGIPELLNLQEVNGQAKPYQIKQLVELIERYNLTFEEPK